MKYIKVRNSTKKIVVDDEDYQRLEPYLWRCVNGAILAWVKNNTKRLSLGRFVLNYDGELVVDHIDRDIFNNQKINLRVATKTQNAQNAMYPNKNGYKGISFHKQTKRWHAKIQVNGKEISLKYHDTKEEAAIAYNKAAKMYHGEFALLNVIHQ